MGYSLRLAADDVVHWSATVPGSQFSLALEIGILPLLRDPCGVAADLRRPLRRAVARLADDAEALAARFGADVRHGLANTLIALLAACEACPSATLGP